MRPGKHTMPPSPSHPRTSAHRWTPYPSNQLPNHARPGAVGLRHAVDTIPDEADLVVEAEDLSQLLEHVHTEALVAVIAFHLLVVPLQH